MITTVEPHCDFQGCVMTKQGFVLVGHVDVDSGIIWVGDPGYIMRCDRFEDKGMDYDAMLTAWPNVAVTVDNSSSVDDMVAASIKDGLLPKKAREIFQQFRTRTQHIPANVHIQNHEAGHPGCGVAVHAGWGDGTYPVWVRYKRDEYWGMRVAEVRAVFIEEV